eukprot:g45424.t1
MKTVMKGNGIWTASNGFTKGGIVVALEDAQDGHVIQGVGRGVEVVRDWEVLSFVAYRAQVFYKAVSEPPFGLTDVEETTLGTLDTIDHIDRCA